MQAQKLARRIAKRFDSKNSSVFFRINLDVAKINWHDTADTVDSAKKLEGLSNPSSIMR